MLCIHFRNIFNHDLKLLLLAEKLYLSVRILYKLSPNTVHNKLQRDALSTDVILNTTIHYTKHKGMERILFINVAIF